MDEISPSLIPVRYRLLLPPTRQEVDDTDDIPVYPSLVECYGEDSFVSLVAVKSAWPPGGVSDAELSRAIPLLCELPELESLDLTGSEITDAGVAELKRIRSLRRICLSHARVSDRGIASLIPLSRLESLDLGGTLVTDASGGTLVQFTRLKDLDLSKTTIGNPMVAQLARLNSIESLDLSGTALGDDAIRFLAEMNGLRRLTVCNTKMSERGTQRLRSVLANTEVITEEAQTPICVAPL